MAKLKGVAEAQSIFTFDQLGVGLDGKPKADGVPGPAWQPHRPERGWEKFEGGRRFKVASDYEPHDPVLRPVHMALQRQRGAG
ncbi:MAG: hypothetical protein AAF253_05615, partial [Pseudomonadota bacterium]